MFLSRLPVSKMASTIITQVTLVRQVQNLVLNRARCQLITTAPLCMDLPLAPQGPAWAQAPLCQGWISVETYIFR